ncbi:alpha-tocopherol transfer protein-like [Trichonephila clavipes]|uniref:Alpha-tocopherol transfer protein-like n=1 Tax=Trichonephila clavipes TaxID=2585209 RepID=A0A8X6V2I3_TRICX|nr:alpha-tocopherol transfer protein-like [Trichonephila clavipes]
MNNIAGNRGEEVDQFEFIPIAGKKGLLKISYSYKEGAVNYLSSYEDMDTAKVITVGSKVYRPLLDETLTADDLLVAREELGETPESTESCLRLLKEMLREQNEFTPRTDDDYLMRFLRCRKFDSKKAFKMIREHYKFRKMNPGVYISPSSIEQVLRACIFDFLPHRDHKGRAIYVIRFNRWNPDKVPFTDFVAAGNLVAENVLDNPVTQINGYIGLWDYAGFTFKQFRMFCNPKNTLMLANLMQDRFPGRFKIAYCVNCLPMVSTVWSILKQLMKEKFKNRVTILSSLEELYQYVDRSVLPKEYGGLLSIPETKEIAQRVLDNEQYTNLNLKFGF